MSFEPPSQAPAGWYPDPHHPGSDRYWNGVEWVAQWRPSSGAIAPPYSSGSGLPDIGDWIGRAFNRALSRWRSATIIALITSAIPTLLFFAAGAYLVDDLVITTDGDVVGWDGGRLPFAIALALVALALSLLGIVAMEALMLRTVDDDQAAASGTLPLVQTVESPVTRAFGAIGTSLRCIPRAIGWFLVAMVGIFGVIVLFIVLALASPVLVVLGVIAAIPVVIWLVIRWSFVVIAVVDGPGNPFSRSAEVVGGRWWGILGRLILIGIITGIIGFVVNTVTTLLGGGGFASGSDLEVDANGNLVNDLVIADLFPTTAWPIAIGVLSQVVINVVSAVSLAAMSEIYRTRHLAASPSALR